MVKVAKQLTIRLVFALVADSKWGPLCQVYKCSEKQLIEKYLYHPNTDEEWPLHFKEFIALRVKIRKFGQWAV